MTDNLHRWLAPGQIVTVAHVEAAVEGIRAVASDPEGAHSAEDSLYALLLQAIAARSCDDPPACAAAALRSADIDFPRWYM